MIILLLRSGPSAFLSRGAFCCPLMLSLSEKGLLLVCMYRHKLWYPGKVADSGTLDTIPRLRLPSGCIPCPTWEFQETEARRFWRRGGCGCSSWLGDMSGKAEIANSRLTLYGWGIPG